MQINLQFSGFSAWIWTLGLIGCGVAAGLGMAGDLENGRGVLVFGLLLLGGAVVISRRRTLDD